MERTTAGISQGTDPVSPHVLRLAEWKALEAEHVAAVDALTAEHLRRRRTGEKHPIIDFLFTYYRSSVGALRTWHPGPGVAIEMEPGRAEMPPGYIEVERDPADGAAPVRAMVLDLDALRSAKERRWSRAARIVAGTRGRAPRFSCFGLHEWAMVYRLRPQEVRHEQVPLRVSPETIAGQVEGGVHCTHFDAFRFFTEPAEDLNDSRLDRDSQLRTEQPACLHAGMDLYRWAAELGPACPSALRLATFRSALCARIIDMRASPYDLRGYGYEPIEVETREGRAEYAAFQRRWAEETNGLRDELLRLYSRIGIETDVETAS
ncbi:hypothetical protein [Dietzia sp.]|uniref:hypothetical protein n=1 Tax=Dietzia sp. TaxID=1871616 RepID=UPI002FDA0976